MLDKTKIHTVSFWRHISVTKLNAIKTLCPKEVPKLVLFNAQSGVDVWKIDGIELSPLLQACVENVE
jgi:hypothetical protein